MPVVRHHHLCSLQRLLAFVACKSQRIIIVASSLVYRKRWILLLKQAFYLKKEANFKNSLDSNNSTQALLASSQNNTRIASFSTLFLISPLLSHIQHNILHNKNNLLLALHNMYTSYIHYIFTQAQFFLTKSFYISCPEVQSNWQKVYFSSSSSIHLNN